MEFSANIKYLRKLKKLTQDDLAKELGLTNTALSNWEQGISTPDVTVSLKLSNIFGVSLNDLLINDIRNGRSLEVIEDKSAYRATPKCDLCTQKDETIEVLKLLTKTQAKQIELLSSRNDEHEAIHNGQKKKAG